MGEFGVVMEAFWASAISEDRVALVRVWWFSNTIKILSKRRFGKWLSNFY